MVPRETSYFCFPSSPDVSFDFVPEKIRTFGKTKLTVSLGTNIKCIIARGSDE